MGQQESWAVFWDRPEGRTGALGKEANCGRVPGGSPWAGEGNPERRMDLVTRDWFARAGHVMREGGGCYGEVPEGVDGCFASYFFVTGFGTWSGRGATVEVTVMRISASPAPGILPAMLMSARIPNDCDRKCTKTSRIIRCASVAVKPDLQQPYTFEFAMRERKIQPHLRFPESLFPLPPASGARTPWLAGIPQTPPQVGYGLCEGKKPPRSACFLRNPMGRQLRPPFQLVAVPVTSTWKRLGQELSDLRVCI